MDVIETIDAIFKQLEDCPHEHWAAKLTHAKNAVVCIALYQHSTLYTHVDLEPEKIGLE